MPAKPGLSVILGIGKKKVPDEAPPDLPKRPGDPLDPNMDDSSDSGDETDPLAAPQAGGEEMDESSGSDLTPDMLDYHGSDTNCGVCSHFSGPSTCDRWPDPVEEAGWCKGFQPMSSGGQNLGAMPSMPSMPGQGGPSIP